MIVFVYGSDSNKTQRAYKAALESLKKKRPDAGFFVVDDESFDEAVFEEFVFGQGLFDRKVIVHLNRVFQNKDAKEYILKKLSDISESDNAFVIVENCLDGKVFKKIEKAAYKTDVFELPLKKEKKRGEFNIFALGDAVGERDKKQAWKLLTEAYKTGVAPEQIHGAIFNQIRNCKLLSVAERQKVESGKLGLHPFVIQKTKHSLKKYSDEDQIRILRELVHSYHDARRGGAELDASLEKIILNI